MRRKGLALLGFLLSLTSLTCAQVTNTGAPEQSNQKPGPEAAACPSSSDEGPRQAVSELFRLQLDRRTPLNSWAGIPEGAVIESLIAAVADPVNTHLSLNTDRGLESLMWAIGDSGYSFERYWLPWSTARLSESPPATDRRCPSNSRRDREDEPGILIFRRDAIASGATGQDYLFVFIVGETPTSGIASSSLSKAIKYIRQINPDSGNIRILGPNFSGSLRPLGTDLVALHEQDRTLSFHIVTGTVSSKYAVDQFTTTLPHGWQYESAVENDERASRLFFHYAGSYWRPEWLSKVLPPGEIVVLSEDETVYGSGDIRGALGDPPIPTDLTHDWLMLRYPREIARLRNADSQEPQTSANQPKQEFPAIEGAPLTLRSSSEAGKADMPTDSVPTLSAQQSPASQQAALLVIAAALRSERAAYAGVVATDVLDSLFLTRFLHIADPDLRLFTLDADLLFLRESQTLTSMTGLLAVTNYPLVSRNQHWTELETKGLMPRRIQFNSRFAEGIYNACRRLIPPVQHAVASGPQPAERYLEYQRPFDERRDGAPLWLTVLGRERYWPIALLDETDIPLPASTLTPFQSLDRNEAGGNEPKPSPPSEPLHPEPPSKGWTLFFLLACLFCFAHSVYVLYLLTRAGPAPAAHGTTLRDRAIRGLATLFFAYPEGKPSEHERPFLLSATVSLFTSMSVIALPMCRFLAFRWAILYFSVACACLLSLLFVAVALSAGKRSYPRILLLTWLLAILFPTIWTYLLTCPGYHTGIFVAYRSLYLGSGVSPGIPIALLALAFYGWAWVHLKRESALVGRIRARANNEFSYLRNLQSLMALTDQRVEDIMSPSISTPALVFLVLWFLLLSPWYSVRSFESYWYDILYILVLTVLYWCLALVWIQFIRCWRQFREFLQALERHPIRGAFSLLPKEISWIPLVSTSPSRNLFVSSRTSESLGALIKTLVKLSPLPSKLIANLEPLYKKSKDALELLDGAVANGGNVDSDVYGNLQIAFDQAAHFVVDDLMPGRWSKGESESLAYVSRSSEPERHTLTPEEKVAILEEEFVALRLLMFIRYIIRQLRNWVGFIGAGFIISVLSMNSYPFQAHRWIGLASMIILIALGSGVVLVFAEMDKDAILSRITDTKENEVGKTFFFRLAKYGALPLLTVLAAQFPGVGRSLFSWLQPALEALK